MQTICINLFGGPCAGKSTTAYALVANLKWMGIDAELVTEFAKDLTWEGSPALDTQMYITGNQIWREDRLMDKVQVLVTDSPIIMSSMYYDGKHQESWEDIVFEVFNSRNNWNFFVVNKGKTYNTNGRNQTEAEARLIGKRIGIMLREKEVPYTVADTDTIIDIVTHEITTKLK